MKKFKKLLAGLLAGAMMLGSMSATAFAAQTTTPATIDTTKTGSLTIHKYEYNGLLGRKLQVRQQIQFRKEQKLLLVLNLRFMKSLMLTT